MDRPMDKQVLLELADIIAKIDPYSPYSEGYSDDSDQIRAAQWAIEELRNSLLMIAHILAQETTDRE